MKDKKSLRWEQYIVRHGKEFDKFWKYLLGKKERRLLFILGQGFDPRMCLGIKTILNSGGSGNRECLLIEYDEGSNSPSKNYSHLVDDNRRTLEALIAGKGKIHSVPLPMWSEDGRRRIGSRSASDIINGVTLDGYSDIVVDISAFPRGIYFPLIAKLLYLHDSMSKKSSNINIHVVITEDVGLDKGIQEEGIDEHASYLPYFSSDLTQQSRAGIPVIWVPVLGEGKEAQLVRIYDLARPDEICPVLPSPARNPRRADNLMQEYRELLFDRLRVEPQNIIYACERNPFETYRQIYRTIMRYRDALDVLGGCKVVVSAVSSKLLSIGALLAAYEAKRSDYMIGVAHVESHGYKMEVHETKQNTSELFSLWLAGECYDE